jgi:RNA polymerase sigma-70 factor (ECF subfamily)
VAHNVAASHVIAHRRQKARALVSLDEVAELSAAGDADAAVDRQKALDQLYALIHRLNPLERQVILLYLEGFDAASIGEITGISPGNVATRIHRLKKILAERFRQGEANAR